MNNPKGACARLSKKHIAECRILRNSYKHLERKQRQVGKFNREAMTGVAKVNMQTPRQRAHGGDPEPGPRGRQQRRPPCQPPCHSADQLAEQSSELSLHFINPHVENSHRPWMILKAGVRSQGQSVFCTSGVVMSTGLKGLVVI